MPTVQRVCLFTLMQKQCESAESTTIAIQNFFFEIVFVAFFKKGTTSYDDAANSTELYASS